MNLILIKGRWFDDFNDFDGCNKSTRVDHFYMVIISTKHRYPDYDVSLLCGIFSFGINNSCWIWKEYHDISMWEILLKEMWFGI